MTTEVLLDEAKVSFLNCLLEMAQAETNPVLEIIDVVKPLQENKKYPTGLLQFNQTGWRAYYHCHPASRAGNHRFQGEHGHFHIFVRIQTDPETWSHLVALAMDNMGQPLGWFTVNHWVTGETWQSASFLTNYLDKIPYAAQDSIVERWLLFLLVLSRERVRSLLYERDKFIELKQDETAPLDVKQNKDLYILSELPVNLEDLLDLKSNHN
jgi:hypothetical protein